MKFYSEELKALFDSAEELEQAEAKHKEKIADKEKKITEVVSRFENCIKEINTIAEEIITVSETLTPSEERKLIRMFMDSLASLNLPLFWQI